MNKLFKSVLLILAVVFSVKSIFYYYESIMELPREVVLVNEHYEEIAALSKQMEKHSGNSLYSFFFKLMDKIKLELHEDFLTVDQRDELVEKTVNGFLPLYIEFLENKFNKSIWTRADLVVMSTRVYDLKALKIKEGSESLIQGEYEERLNEFLNIVGDYNFAVSLCEKTDYEGIEKSGDAISVVRQYAGKKYLAHCSELVEALNGVPVKIEQNHIFSLKNKAGRLSQYDRFDKPSYKVYYNSVINLIQEYKNNVDRMYGHPSAIGGLENEVARCYDEAMYFYNTQNQNRSYNTGTSYNNSARSYNYESSNRQINVSFFPQWMTMDSPHPSYKAYQSVSNYHEPNSTATMSFTIIGYDQFSFKIASNGELMGDYLMIGLNRMPTLNDNYATTKRSLTQDMDFNNYKTVRFTGLDKNSAYTIYVVYRKDSSVDRNADRGYVLIPN